MKAEIKFKSELAEYKTIAQRNKRFDSLNDEGKRLEIAWDALQLILKGKLLAAGNNKGSEYWDDRLHKVKGDSKTLQKYFNVTRNIEKCEVCARGAMMLCQIRLGNGISSSDDDRSDGNEDNLKGFSIESFQEMEREFEKSFWDHPYPSNTEMKLANICCNVLVNGDFNPKDDSDYLTLSKEDEKKLESTYHIREHRFPI